MQMPARSTLMPKGYFDSLRLRIASGRLTPTVQVAQYKSTNVIATSNSLLPSQRRMDNLDTPFPAQEYRDLAAQKLV